MQNLINLDVRELRVSLSVILSYTLSLLGNMIAPLNTFHRGSGI